MSVAVAAADGCFLSALKPNSSRTSYGVPSDLQIAADGPLSDSAARARRVQEQVRMRLAEKKTSSIPRPNGSVSGSTDYNSPPTWSYTANQGFSSKSLTHTPSRVLSVASVPLPQGHFSSRSAVGADTSRSFQISQGSTLVHGNYQTATAPPPRPRNRRSKSLCQEDMEEFQVLVGMPPRDRGTTTVPRHPPSVGGTMRRSLSGTLAREGGGSDWQEELAFQQTYKGPSHRTISGTLLGAGQYQEPLYRAASVHSVRSVGKGIDVMDHTSNHSIDKLGGENQEVQRFATGAARNLIYENAENKAALIAAGGVAKLVEALKEPDEELRKNVTGILWNLSSKDNLKEKLSKEALPELTERVLVPLCCAQDSGAIFLSPSEKDVFYNTTGCLRNLSSVNERTRQKMRDVRGLVDSLVAYVKNALQEDIANDKGVENTLCILRNLSYQLYSELPHTTRQRLEAGGIEQRHPEMTSMFSEVSAKPRGAEWLWHPQLVALYKAVLQNNTSSSVTREAALGALQNITIGDSRWPWVLSYVILEQERMLPLLLELLDTHSELEMKPLTGLLRNLARHARDKNHMAKSMVNVLVAKLPGDGLQKEPSSEVVVNICGALNQLVTGSSLAARDITFFDGVPKLLAIKTSHDNSTGGLKAAKAASTVLCNMFQYNKLHKDYKLKGFTRRDFTEGSLP
ncbi:hypothetical protein NHX12_005444 [Muraenolepis orangiensis]|uniref:Plakophilin 3 n=1 Tax=Muraenolepis orangiensis TaxID=630683 RepID=A0A9Q0DRK8_9TELE|nr:hypothetical protein NHX12_005444 [Muraenolepis orangiensis]